MSTAGTITVVTGASGLIGSALLWKLHGTSRTHSNLVAVDLHYDTSPSYLPGFPKDRRLLHSELPAWLLENRRKVERVIHLGAISDTTITDVDLLWELNYQYSKRLFTLCTELGLPFYWASSAATYGAQSDCLDDDARLPLLRPLNPYAWSKHIFDRWALEQSAQPPHFAGFKFFNVFGPNEYHKGRMASVVLHAFNQIRKRGFIELFESGRDDIADGEQSRDFVYVKDIVDMIDHFINARPSAGIYNMGTGEARTFRDLAAAVFSAMGQKIDIRFIPMPGDLAERYQYRTCARIDRLRLAGYGAKIGPLEKGVSDYVLNYLLKNKACLGAE